jgi:hypothetical protein
MHRLFMKGTDYIKLVRQLGGAFFWLGTGKLSHSGKYSAPETYLDLLVKMFIAF